MKLLRSVKIIPAFTAVLSAALLTVAISGCGDATTATGSSSTSKFTVSPGDYIRRTVEGDGKISFTVQGVDMDLESDKQPVVYFYDDNGYGHGRTTGGFQGELRNYKLKYYDLTGDIVSESYHGYRFSSSQSYSVILEWKTGSDGWVKSTVDGKEFSKPGQVPSTFTLGIGYPPPGTPGWDGAIYTNIVWPKGSKEKKD